MFGNIGPWELILILIVALVVVGPGKLPEVAKSIGKGLNEFKRATSGVKKEFQDAINAEIKPVTDAIQTNIKNSTAGLDLNDILSDKTQEKPTSASDPAPSREEDQGDKKSEPVVENK